MLKACLLKVPGGLCLLVLAALVVLTNAVAIVITLTIVSTIIHVVPVGLGTGTQHERRQIARPSTSRHRDDERVVLGPSRQAARCSEHICRARRSTYRSKKDTRPAFLSRPGHVRTFVAVGVILTP